MAFDREARPARPNRGKRRKVCQFCADKCEYIDYKDAAKLRRFVSERSKILPRRTHPGTCAMHQRQLTEAIKRARQIRPAALRSRLSFSSRSLSAADRLFGFAEVFMFSITLICMGKLKERFYTEAAAEYAKRLRAYCDFQLIELPECRLPEDPNDTQIAQGLQKEAELIRAKLPKGCFFCVLRPELPVPVPLLSQPVPSGCLSAEVRRFHLNIPDAPAEALLHRSLLLSVYLRKEFL